MKNLQNVKAISVFKYFEEISMIPRGSGNEKEISDYLVKFAKKLKLEVIQDKALNVIIKKPASKGYENAPTVILQGHMDMVCEKNIGTNHDFKKDPLKLVTKGNYIYAQGTTLGADDGIAVAYAMAILASDKIKHPALEILLTTDEESGMTGAMAISKKNISGKILINIDTEEEGYLLVSCAGGIRTKSIIDIEKESIKDKKTFEIKVRGLKGGHSGTDIDKGRGNANVILGRILKDLQGKIDYNIISIDGGTKNNAIPREGDAIIAVLSKDEKALVESIKVWNEMIIGEIKTEDPNVNIILNRSIKESKNMINKDCSCRLINLLYLYPNGVNTVSYDIKGLTESSTNLGIVKTTEDEIEFDSAVRSSVPSLKGHIVTRIETITSVLGGKFEANAGYPAWEYKKDSKIREICKDVYKNMYNKDVNVYAIHAGVECGLFEERLGEIDMISFGPDIFDAHTPEEHLSISSTDRVFEYLLEVLKNIK